MARYRRCISDRFVPGPDPDLSPAYVRALAAALLRVADDCEALRPHTLRYGPVRRQYEVGA